MANYKNGSTGENVRKIQEQLQNAGYNISADGIYGPKTEAAVRDYQSKNGLSVDGIVGVNTSASLNNSSSASSSGPIVQGGTSPYNAPTYDPGAYGPSSNVTYGASSGSYGKRSSGSSRSYSASQSVLDALDELNSFGSEYDKAFETSERTDAYGNKLNGLENRVDNYGPYTESDNVKRYQDARNNYENQINNYGPYVESDAVIGYRNKLKELEDTKVDPFESRYEPQIQSILNNIMNPKSFDINTDSNYKNLYDKYSQRYQAQASRAMRDSIANAAGMTGGYGNTYAQMVGQQAYDQTMEGLNDRNITLMQMARQMYDTDRADTYNQLNAVQGLDNTDYSRYRDTVNDIYNNRDYYANRYDTERSLDYGRYNDLLDRLISERDYNANMANGERSFDYQVYNDALDNLINNRDYYANMFNNERNWDYGTYRDEVADYNNNRNFALDKYNTLYTQDYNSQMGDRDYDYQVDRDEVGDYYNALDTAYKLNNAGYGTPSRVASDLGDDANIFNTAVAVASGPSSSGGSSSTKSSTKKTTSTWDSSKSTDDEPDTWAKNKEYFDTVATTAKTKEQADKMLSDEQKRVLNLAALYSNR